ncbi:MAG: J domain-containing protein [Parvularculaceae bacterium]
MSDYSYKPRLGFDIRVRPPEPEARPAWAEAIVRPCAAPGCGQRAVVLVAKSPRAPADRLWLCSAHAQEHNRNWNFFEGLSEREAEATRTAAQYGDRPTWSMGKNARAKAGQRLRGPADILDAFGFFSDAARRGPTQERMREGRVLTKLQAQAFETLGLQPTAKGPDIRRRYAELVRQYHPDANGGDRSAEAQLTAVVKAHQILKKARIC